MSSILVADGGFESIDGGLIYLTRCCIDRSVGANSSGDTEIGGYVLKGV